MRSDSVDGFRLAYDFAAAVTAAAVPARHP